MNPPAFDNYSVPCPHCGATNTITTVDIPERMQIDCSACLAPLGSWGEIRTEISRDDRSAAR
ncbi:hypothetical protein C8N35_1116 [Breoghania corrubedonensis]|uniref:Uncharacterized protein n=1 Tax=Breoghania corrubedonensis TaxID=665038 RepID=A0A2T5UYF3_9HYPH|nr:hypothetical protein [Breoghania corrubedonensis]PTW56543.1 hypothetical protein C8N35_1116 [Breoghania corrubedonensis]